MTSSLTTTSQKFKHKLNCLLSECNFQQNKSSYLNDNMNRNNNKTPYKEKSDHVFNTISNLSSSSRVNSNINRHMENIKFDYSSKEKIRNIYKDYSNRNDKYDIYDKYDRYDNKRNDFNEKKSYSSKKCDVSYNDKSFSYINIDNKENKENKENYNYKNISNTRKSQLNLKEEERKFKKKDILSEENKKNSKTSNQSILKIGNMNKTEMNFNEEDDFYNRKPNQISKIQREFQRLTSLINDFDKKDKTNEMKYTFYEGNILNRQSRVSKNEVNDFNPYLSVSKDYQFRMLSRSKNKIIK